MQTKENIIYHSYYTSGEYFVYIFSFSYENYFQPFIIPKLKEKIYWVLFSFKLFEH